MAEQKMQSLAQMGKVFDVPKELAEKAHIKSMAQY